MYHQLKILLDNFMDLIPSLKMYTFPLALGSILLSALFLFYNYGEVESLFMGMICIDHFSHYF